MRAVLLAPGQKLAGFGRKSQFGAARSVVHLKCKAVPLGIRIHTEHRSLLLADLAIRQKCCGWQLQVARDPQRAITVY